MERTGLYVGCSWPAARSASLCAYSRSVSKRTTRLPDEDDGSPPRPNSSRRAAADRFMSAAMESRVSALEGVAWGGGNVLWDAANCASYAAKSSAVEVEVLNMGS